MKKIMALTTVMLLISSLTAGCGRTDTQASPYQASSIATSEAGNAPNKVHQLSYYQPPIFPVPAYQFPITTYPMFPGQPYTPAYPQPYDPAPSTPVASPNPNAGDPPPAANPGGNPASAFAQQVLQLVNQERAKAGLNALRSDGPLANMAMVKAQDLYNNNYFDHQSPTYGSPFDMMKRLGISYQYAGENIAKGQPTPQQVMNDWMNSPGHRANILKSNYTSIGIAQYNRTWVQEFTG
jgi:uncharacterized YkwD family protein